MANRYANLTPSAKISEEYTKITTGFDRVQQDIDTLGERVDNIITTPVDSVSAQEIIDARKGAPTLGKRFDKIDERLNLRTYLKYGPIDLSKFTGFMHNINFNLWRDPSDGRIKHDWVLDDSEYEVRYVRRAGSASNDGKTEATANSGISSLIDIIENDPTVSKVKIVVLDILHRAQAQITLNTVLTKDYIITSQYPIGSVEYIQNYVLDENGLYKAPFIYSPRGVYRIDELDVKGNPRLLQEVSTLQECIDTYNSYYADGSYIYINKEDTNNTNTVVLVSDTVFQFRLTQPDQTIILDGLTLLSGASTQPCYFESDTGTKGHVILNNCRLVNSGRGSSANGFSTDGIKDIKLFNCKVFNVIRDGFNYHNTREVNGKGTVFEYECYAENTGVDTSTSNNNISTAHEGIHILRVGTKGRSSRGPLIADVNGCYSVNIDVEVYDTRVANLYAQNTAFWFDDTPSDYAPNPDGKAWLINCAGGSRTEWGINCGATFKAPNKIYVDNFRGTNIPDDVVLTPFEL